MAGIEARFLHRLGDFTLDVDLALPSHGVTALFGPSGSGKTTLLRCIAGLERASQGRLSVGGEVWQGEGRWLPTHRRPIGYVFQEPSLFPHLTVLGNLRYGQRRGAGLDGERLDQAIALLGLRDLLGRPAGRLSGGERQRVAIARALAVGPRLLLMDEPLSALDLRRKLEILPYLERLHEALEIPLLYVTHSADEVARLADHLVVLEAGRSRAHGPLRETLVRLDLPIRLDEDVGAVLDGTVTALDAPWHLARIEFPGGGLWTPDRGLEVGRRVRVRVLARDVSLAREAPARSSIQNVLEGTVDALGDDDHPGLGLVRVRLGGSAVVARLTRRAVAELELAPGQRVWVQVKSVALVE